MLPAPRIDLLVKHRDLVEGVAGHGGDYRLVDVDRQHTAANILWSRQEAMRTAVTAFGKEFAAAQLNGDFDRTTLLSEQVMAAGIPLSSVMKSANTILRREQTGDVFSRYDKVQAAQMRMMLGE